MGKIVSIRCRKHRKRFNVPAEWVETCGWLCPKCYESMSATQRKKYSPTEDSDVTPRAAEPNKSTMQIPKSLKEKESNAKESKSSARSSSAGNGRRLDSIKGNCLDRKNGLQAEMHHEAPVRYGVQESSLSRFLPRHEVYCQKCGKTARCHKIWFLTSRVLCPECASFMSNEEIAEFNRIHPYAITAIDIGNKSQQESHGSSGKFKMQERKTPEDNFVERMSEERIRRSTIQQLRQAVESGRLSKVRYRIETRRRAKPWLYN